MDSILDTLFPNLADKGVTYDDLTEDEKKTYHEMLKIQEETVISLDQFKQFVHQLKQTLEFEMVKLPEHDPKLPNMRARLHVYLLFEAFFERPEKAKQMLEQFRRPR